jgi:hypothetical protein
MASEYSQRIENYCTIIWGISTNGFELDVETDDWETYSAMVRKDNGDSFGPPLMMTGICRSQDEACEELERMLRTWADQIRSEAPMTRAQKLEIFGGRRGEQRPILEMFMDKLEQVRPGHSSEGNRSESNAKQG